MSNEDTNQSYEVVFAPRQDQLRIKFYCQGLPKATIARADISESLSNLFHCNIFLHTYSDINIESIINRKASLSIDIEHQRTRYFSGIIDSASFENVPHVQDRMAENVLYVRIAPTLCRLGFRTRYHIFQDRTIRDILQTLLKDHGVSNYKFAFANVKDDKLPLVIQYNESDLHFFSRVCEEHGVFFYFQCDQEGDELILADNSAGASKLSAPLGLIKSRSSDRNSDHGARYVAFYQTVGYKSVRLQAFAVNTAQSLESTAASHNAKWKTTELDHYDNKFQQKEHGSELAGLWLDQFGSEAQKLKAGSYCPEVYPGAVALLTGSTTEKNNGSFFVLSVKHVINQLNSEEGSTIYENRFEAIPQSVKYRSVRNHQKKYIFGCQTAIVIGPKEEEIYCDAVGRVLIKFHWAQPDHKGIWVRVAQTLAGASFGGLFIPRVGMEVIVNFENGDPEQPLVTGCVYNGTHKPVAEYVKGGDISSIRTKTVKGTGYNEMRFKDRAGSEEIYIHAQKNLVREVEGSITETIIGGSRTSTFESKDGKIHNVLQIKTGDNRILITEGNMSIVLDHGDHSLTLKQGNQTVTLSNGNLTLEVAGGITIKSSKDISIEAGGKLTLNSSKDTSIKSSSDLSIQAKNNQNTKANNINHKANTNLTIKGGSTSVDASMTTSIKGAVAVKVSGGIISLN